MVQSFAKSNFYNFLLQSWSQTSILTRQQVMFKLQHIIRANMGELAKSITSEQGKTLVDAEGDVLRGLRKFYLEYSNPPSTLTQTN